MPISVIFGVVQWFFLFSLLFLFAEYKTKNSFFLRILLSIMVAIGLQILMGFILALMGLILGIITFIIVFFGYLIISPLLYVVGVPLIF